MPWQIDLLGDGALLVSVSQALSDVTQRLRTVALKLEHSQRTTRPRLRGVLGWTLGLDTLLVCYDPLETDGTQVHRWLLRQLQQTNSILGDNAPLIEVPVLYGGQDGPDLEDVARATHLSVDEVVRLHCAGSYSVLMVGFAPGYPYIGGLPAPLHLPRRAVPRTHVPPGSVAIAGDMVGIYPQRSPGGWHLIGRTSLRLFDPQSQPPALFQPGDRVRFVAE